ncbi:MAG: DUF4837 family protein [Saprospiraceae bacterium]|nr:DUF4837 family protein [Saprospiraceae bacterium]
MNSQVKTVWGVLIVLVIFIISSCTDEARKRLEPTPNAIGSLNQLAIIADEDVWDSAIGDSINYYFGSAFPILPQPESLFDLKHFTTDDLDAEHTRKELKAYLIIADISDEHSSTAAMVMEDLGSEKIARALQDTSFHTSMGRDRWAKDQVIVYLFANGKRELARQVVKRFPSIAKIIQEQYRKQIDATVYLGGEDNAIINQISQTFGIHLAIPKEYRIMPLEDENTMWLMRENELIITNILIHKMPYKNQDQFKKDKIIALQDTLGKKYISSTIEGSYMRTNDQDLPVYTQSMTLGGAYAVEARGIWEMEGDFLGGPFLSYLILNEAKGELIFIDAFVLAPGERKRNQMLYLEHIISSFTFNNVN